MISIDSRSSIALPSFLRAAAITHFIPKDCLRLGPSTVGTCGRDVIKEC